jgi:hypothetical protein
MVYNGRWQLSQRNKPFMKSTIHNYQVPAVPVKLTSTATTLAQHVKQLEEEIATRSAELQQKQIKARLLQDRHSQLQSLVDNAADRLLIATNQNEFFKARRQELLNSMVEAWANPHKNRAVDYSGILSCEKAIADFPRVQAILLDAVNLAEGNLAEWSRENNL